MINQYLDEIKFDNLLDVSTNDTRHINLLKKYINTHLNINDDTFINSILSYINNKFISIKILYQLLQSKTFEFENNVVDEEQIIIKFLKLQESNYSEKFYKTIKQMLYAISISRKLLTIEELIYLIDYEDINFRSQQIDCIVIISERV